MTGSLGKSLNWIHKGIWQHQGQFAVTPKFNLHRGRWLGSLLKALSLWLSLSVHMVYSARLKHCFALPLARIAVLIRTSKNNSWEACCVRGRWLHIAPGRKGESIWSESPKSWNWVQTSPVATAISLVILMESFQNQGSSTRKFNWKETSRPTILSKPH